MPALSSKGKCTQHILMVSSMPELTQIFSASLLPHCNGHQVDTFIDAKKVFRKHKPHLVFLDQDLPNHNVEKLITEFHNGYPSSVMVFIADGNGGDLWFRIWGKVKELIRKPVTALQLQECCDKYCLFPERSISAWRMAHKIILQRFSDPALSEQGIAVELGLTPAYFSRLFKSKLGLTFNEKLHAVRIAAAKESLYAPDSQIKQIANTVGYDRVDSFIRFFHHYTGESPTEYRRRLIINGVNAKLHMQPGEKSAAES